MLITPSSSRLERKSVRYEVNARPADMNCVVDVT